MKGASLEGPLKGPLKGAPLQSPLTGAPLEGPLKGAPPVDPSERAPLECPFTGAPLEGPPLGGPSKVAPFAYAHPSNARSACSRRHAVEPLREDTASSRSETRPFLHIGAAGRGRPLGSASSVTQEELLLKDPQLLCTI